MGVKVLVFTAKWCGPCRAAKPKLWELEALGFDITYYDVEDTDASKFDEYSIAALPTFVVRKDNDPLYLKTQDIRELEDWLNALHQTGTT